jgi:tetratricopeptide (TPR) repeat protein
MKDHKSTKWEQLRSGETGGIDVLRETFVKGSDPASILDLGIAYLWLGQYNAAWEHFQHVIETSPLSPARFYGMAGVAKWCLGDYDAAASLWKAGSDIAGTEGEEATVGLALLRLAASVFEPDGRTHKVQAWAVLSSMLPSSSSEGWPGTLIHVVLGMRPTVELPKEPNITTKTEEHQREWLADFYRAVQQFHRSFPPQHDLASQRTSEMKLTMRQLMDIDRYQWASISGFRSLISQEEFFIARALVNESLPMASAQPEEVAAWNQVKRGNAKYGLDLLTERYLKGPSANVVSLGAAYLWLKDYAAAWNHFQYAIKNDRWTHDHYYGLAGIAKWCLGDFKAAVDCWRSGLKCQYGWVGNRLLLFAASILRKGIIQEQEAIALLREKANDRRADFWPGSLVGFCLARGNAELDLGTEKPGSQMRLALTTFYKTILYFNEGEINKAEFRTRMRELTDTSESDTTAAISLPTFAAEFYMARYEVFHS